MTHLKTKKYWLDLPKSKDLLFRWIIALACLAALPDILALFHILYDKHPSTELENIPVFYGLYSMISFLTLLTVAKGVQVFLTRDEDYYD